MDENTVDWNNPDAPVAGTVKSFQDAVLKKANELNAKNAVPPVYTGIGLVRKSGNGKDEEVTAGRIFTKYAMSLAVGGSDIGKAVKHAEDIYKVSKSGLDNAVLQALTLTSFVGGGALVPEEIAEDIIEMIYPNSVIRTLGAEVLPLVNGQLSMNAETAQMAAQYIGERKKAPLDQPKFGRLKMTQRKLALMCAVSNDLLRTKASAKVEESIMRNIQNAFSAAENIHFIRGNGTEEAPQGILHQVDSTHKFDAYSGTTTVDSVTDDIGTAIGLVEEALEGNMVKPAFLFNTRTKTWLMKQRDGNGNYIWRDEIKAGTFEGYPFRIVNQIPKNLGTGGNESEIYFGDFSRVTIGDSMQMIFDADPRASYWDGQQMQSAYQNDETLFRAIAGHDILLRYAKSFAVIQKVKYGA